MSHAATNWAIQQRGLDPAVKIVLWHLADCHNPAQGCFPTQKYLAENAELSRASVNRHLAALEAKGLIVRERRFDPVRQRQLETRYYLACEPDFEAHRRRIDAGPVRGKKPCLRDGHGAEHQMPVEPCLRDGHGAVSQIPVEPCLRASESRVSTCDTNPVKEPVREPSSRASAVAGGRFDEFWAEWPEAERPKARGYALRMFGELTREHQLHAIRLAANFRSQRRAIHEMALMIPYLKLKHFLDFVEAPPVDVEGYFVITPDRQEWLPWMEFHRRSCSPSVIAGIERGGKLLRKSRWPDSDRSAAVLDIRP